MGFLTDVLGSIGDVVGGLTKQVAPWMPAISGAVSGFGAYQGQVAANEANVDLSRMTNAFNAEQAMINRDFSAQQAAAQMKFQDESVDKAMAFSERMSNTAWQRGVKDMQSAGLNPMLAYSQGGASAPVGASAGGAAGQGSPARGVLARVENAIAPAINSANVSSRVTAELQNMREQNENLRSQRERIEAETELLKAQVPKVQADTILSTQSGWKVYEERFKVQQEVGKLHEEMHRATAHRRNLESQTAINKFDLEVLRPLAEKLLDAQQKLATLEIPLASNLAGAQGSWWMKNVSPYLKDVPFVGSGIRAGGSVGLRVR